MLANTLNNGGQTTMELKPILDRATGADEHWSERQKHAALHAMLQAAGHTDITIKGVEKWFFRGSISSKWLGRVMEVAANAGRAIAL